MENLNPIAEFEKMERSVRDLYPEATDAEIDNLIWNIINKTMQMTRMKTENENV